MSTTTELLTYKDLEQIPDDGRRYEIIDGKLYVSITPVKAHQRLLLRVMRSIYADADELDAGEAFLSPVDARFSDFDQVQPDIIFIRRERSEIYQESTVFGPPDLVVEILSPATRAVDEGVKTHLYERGGVPELLIADPDTPALRPFVLRDGRLAEVEPDPDGRLHSTVVPGLVFDPATLLANLHD